MQRADSSLGEQFARSETGTILSSESSSLPASYGTGPINQDKNERILAGLMFSQNDILEDVLNNLQYLDEEFVSFLQNKIDKANDIEERVGLKSLMDVVTNVLERVRAAKDEGLTDESAPPQEMEISDIRRRMQEVQIGGAIEAEENKPAVFSTFTVQSDKRTTFLSVLARFQNLPSDVTLADAVRANYELCDKEFMDELRAEIADCVSQGAEIEAQEYQLLLNEITKAMAERLSSAQTKLQSVLEAGRGRGPDGVKAMESRLVQLDKEKALDEALVLLMEANLQQASAAGADQVAEVFKKLIRRAADLRERSLPDEQRLLRQLMRVADSEERKGLLYAAFKPSKRLQEEGGLAEGPPLIPPPAFIA